MGNARLNRRAQSRCYIKMLILALGKLGIRGGRGCRIDATPYRAAGESVSTFPQVTSDFPFFILQKKYLSYAYVCVPEHMYVHQMLICVKEPSGARRGMNPLGLELQGL